ncbi:hydrolase [Nocardioides sp. YIM 123512]|uniref:Hydrolase n=1 Tax=Nocardioides flavescens TaxID=2691959 RepID=A0A6L7ENR6_9ACTN|nr:carbon-nitrogen hydrolase family protein [Nocardioides flavescens]MXG88987.1 hydrolase [Nocardioides flavescens]
MSVTVVQVASSLDPEVNRDRLASQVGDGADLVVLPEAAARDFGPAGSDVSAYAETLDGPFASEVARLAADRTTTVVAGMFERSDDPARPWNTLVVRGAAEAAYRKIHLYDSFGYRESDALTAGRLEPVVVEVPARGDGAAEPFRVGLMTCYDLRFPEHARLLVDGGAEVLVVPSAWVAGSRKLDHWRTLVRARAIENTVYVVAAAQSGPRYTGHSLVVDPLGDVLAEAGEGDETLGATLERDVLDDARRTNPSLANRRLPPTAL